MTRPRFRQTTQPNALTGYIELPGHVPLPNIAGCRERLALDLWWDRNEQRLVACVEYFDEATNPSQFRHCRILGAEAGPFGAADDVDQAVRLTAITARRLFRLP